MQTKNMIKKTPHSNCEEITNFGYAMPISGASHIKNDTQILTVLIKNMGNIGIISLILLTTIIP